MEGSGFSLYSSASPDGAVVSAVWRRTKLEELAEEEEELDVRSRSRADAARTSRLAAAAVGVGVPAHDGTVVHMLLG